MKKSFHRVQHFWRSLSLGWRQLLQRPGNTRSSRIIFFVNKFNNGVLMETKTNSMQSLIYDLPYELYGESL